MVQEQDGHHERSQIPHAQQAGYFDSGDQEAVSIRWRCVHV